LVSCTDFTAKTEGRESSGYLFVSYHFADESIPFPSTTVASHGAREETDPRIE
jgi:hypothetical protein